MKEESSAQKHNRQKKPKTQTGQEDCKEDFRDLKRLQTK